MLEDFKEFWIECMLSEEYSFVMHPTKFGCINEENFNQGTRKYKVVTTVVILVNATQEYKQKDQRKNS